MVGTLPGFCARAVNGQAAAAPLTKAMKSRRLIGGPPKAADDRLADAAAFVQHSK